MRRALSQDGYVVVEGTFNAKQRGHLSMFSGSLETSPKDICIKNAIVRSSLRANIRETVDPLEFSVQGGEAKGA